MKKNELTNAPSSRVRRIEDHSAPRWERILNQNYDEKTMNAPERKRSHSEPRTAKEHREIQTLFFARRYQNAMETLDYIATAIYAMPDLKPTTK